MRDQLELPARPVLFLDEFGSPDRTWSKVSAWLAAGMGTLHHPFHWPAVSTISEHGFPEVRVVVLRRFDPEDRTVVFHTDVRSPKVAELRRDGRCGLLFYDPDNKLQLRLKAIAAVRHGDEFARREFDSLLPHTRASYASGVAPGGELSTDHPFDYPPRPPVDETVAYQHFAAVVCQVQSADVLELHEHGHRRAVLTWENGQARVKRVMP